MQRSEAKKTPAIKEVFEGVILAIASTGIAVVWFYPDPADSGLYPHKRSIHLGV